MTVARRLGNETVIDLNEQCSKALMAWENG
jgi:hypothetical protein